jgi:hypothetical protein
MRWTGAILIAALLAGCAHYDKLNTTSFSQTASGFEFRAAANPEHPLDDKAAEAWRMNLLENYLEEHHLCPNGYNIAERVPTLGEQSAAGNSYDIRYTGSCR